MAHSSFFVSSVMTRLTILLGCKQTQLGFWTLDLKTLTCACPKERRKAYHFARLRMRSAHATTQNPSLLCDSKSSWYDNSRLPASIGPGVEVVDTKYILQYCLAGVVYISQLRSLCSRCLERRSGHTTQWSALLACSLHNECH